MSNELTTITAPQFTLTVGTKKAPQEIAVCRAGVALTMGKAGKAARAQSVADLPRLAVNGAYATFSAFLMTTFPKAARAFLAGAAEMAKMAETGRVNGVQLTPQQREEITKIATKGAECRAGFGKLCDLCLSTEKTTKAQAAALELVRQYGTLMEQAAAAKAAQEGTK